MKGHQLVLKAREAVVLATEANQSFLLVSWDTLDVFQRGFFSPFCFFLVKKYFEKPHLLVSERRRQPGSRGCNGSVDGPSPRLPCKGDGSTAVTDCHREMTPLV